MYLLVMANRAEMMENLASTRCRGSCVSGVNLKVLNSFTHPVCPEPVCTSSSSSAEQRMLHRMYSRLPLDAAPAPLTGPPGECGPGSHRARASACRYIDHSSNDLLILSLRAAHLLLFQLTGTFPVVDLVLIESRVNSGISRVSYVFVPHEGLGGIAI